MMGPNEYNHLKDFVQIPTEDELRNRITLHFQKKPDDDRVILAWASYIAALGEWGLLAHDVQRRLQGLFPAQIYPEVRDIMTGFESDPSS